MARYHVLWVFFCLFLCSCTMLQDSVYRLVCDYNYSVKTTYIGTGDDYSVEFRIHEGPNTQIAEYAWRQPPPYTDKKIKDRGFSGIGFFNQKPSPVINISWTELFNGKEVSYNQKVTMNVPKEFTRYDGVEIWFLFRNGEVLVIYTYKSGPPREEYKPEGILDRRIWRKRNYILADGTPFDWNECADYFDSHPRATIKDFVKWLKNKK